MILRKDGYDEYEQRVINEMPISINMKAKVVDPPRRRPARRSAAALPEAPPAAPRAGEQEPEPCAPSRPSSRRSRSTPSPRWLTARPPRRTEPQYGG